MSKMIYTQGLPDLLVHNVDVGKGVESISIPIRGLGPYPGRSRPRLESNKVECAWPGFDAANDHDMWLSALDSWWRDGEAKSSLLLMKGSPLIYTLEGLRPYRLSQLDRIFVSPLRDNEKLKLDPNKDTLLILTFDYFTESRLPVPEPS